MLENYPERKQNRLEADSKEGESPLESAEEKTGFESFVAKHGLSGSTLKLIAVITMFIDHVGAGIIENFAVQHPDELLFGMDYDRLYMLDKVLRGIGRIAFPIFCFLLVEGFSRTKNGWKYFSRLVIFGVISEVPFDLCFFRSAWYAPYQNVYFTLALGLLMMICMERIAKLGAGVQSGDGSVPEGIRAARIVMKILTLAAFAAVAQFLMTDYYMLGIFTIFLLYQFKKTRLGTCAAHALSCVLILGEIPALAGTVPIALYNGKRGFKMKYFFYFFYPAHLMILWGISRMLGIS